MSGVKGEELEKRSFFWEHNKSRAVYHDGWKLVSDKTPWKLFDLNNDPVEKSDLSKSYPERTAALKKLWEKWGEKNNVTPYPERKKKGKKKKKK